MKLHHDPVSTTSRAVLMLIEEIGLSMDTAVVDLFQGQHRSADFAALNPNCAVPVLEDGDFVLTEGSSILKHLAEGHGLYPADPRARARVNQAMDWFNTGFYRDFGYGLVYAQTLPDYRYEDPAVQAETVRRAEARARRWLEILDRSWLAEGPYLCGADPTIADLMGASYVTLGDWIGYDFAPYPKVVRWLDAMRARPSWAAVHGPWDALVASLRQSIAA